MKKRWLILYCVCLQWLFCGAQPSADTEKTSTSVISRQIEMVDSLLIDGASLKKADSLLRILHTASNIEKYPAQAPWVYYYQAFSAFYKADYIKSIILLQQAVAALKKIPEDEKTMRCKIKVYNLIGLDYSDINDWENAQLNYQKALVYALQQKDSSSVAKIYLNTAFIFIDYQDWKNASINLYKSLDYLTGNGAKEYHASIFSSLAKYLYKKVILFSGRNHLQGQDYLTVSAGQRIIILSINAVKRCNMLPNHSVIQRCWATPFI
jgi:tetratricopeptide (TPR) repeat protein